MGMHDLFGVVDDPVTEAANADVTGLARLYAQGPVE